MGSQCSVDKPLALSLSPTALYFYDPAIVFRWLGEAGHAGKKLKVRKTFCQKTKDSINP